MNITRKTKSRINIAVTLVAAFAMVITPFAQTAYAVDWYDDSSSVNWYDDSYSTNWYDDSGSTNWYDDSSSVNWYDSGSTNWYDDSSSVNWYDSGSTNWYDDSSSVNWYDSGSTNWYDDSSSVNWYDDNSGINWYDDNSSINWYDDSSAINWYDDNSAINWYDDNQAINWYDDSSAINWYDDNQAINWYDDTCGSNCYPQIYTPTYIPSYSTVCYDCYTPTYIPQPVYIPTGGTDINNNDNDNTNVSDNDNVNNNVNDININIPDIHYPDINIVNNNVNNNGGNGGGGNPCGYWNNWCNPNPQPQPNPTVDLNADQTSLTSGQSTTLRWTSSNANSCYASSGWSGTKNTQGSEFTGALYSTQTYTITCTGTNGQTVSDSVTVYVSGINQNYPTVDLNADQVFLNSGQATTLRWTSTNANYCTASNGWSGSKSTYGTEPTGALFNTTTYTITCYGYNGQSVNDSVTVNVSGVVPNQSNTVVTQSPTGVTTNSALLNGQAINNVPSNSTLWFEWGTTSFLGSETQRQSVGYVNGSRAFNQSLFGLSPNTTYYYRAVSQTSTGTARGLILSFTTGSVLGVYTGPTTQTRVTIEKTVDNISNPNGTDERVTAWPGDELVYTIRIENTGTTNLRNLTVVDELPEGIVYIDGGSYDSKNKKVTWDIDRLNAGDEKVITLEAMVTECACAVDKNTISNTAYVSGASLSKRTSNNADVVVSNNDLVITLEADRNQVMVGDIVNYELVLENTGDEILEDGLVRIVLPDTLKFLSSTEAYRENSNVYTFDLNTLRPSRDEVITISVEVKDGITAREEITVSAVVSFEDSNGADLVTDIDETIYGSDNLAGVAAVGLSGFLPSTLLGWLLLIILLVILFLLIRWLFAGAKKEENEGNTQNVSFGSTSYRSPSAFDGAVNGNGNGANTVAFDHGYDQSEYQNDLGNYTNGTDSGNSFPNNLPR